MNKKIFLYNKSFLEIASKKNKGGIYAKKKQKDFFLSDGNFHKKTKNRSQFSEDIANHIGVPQRQLKHFGNTSPKNGETLSNETHQQANKKHQKNNKKHHNNETIRQKSTERHQFGSNYRHVKGSDRHRYIKNSLNTNDKIKKITHGKLFEPTNLLINYNNFDKSRYKLDHNTENSSLGYINTNETFVKPLNVQSKVKPSSNDRITKKSNRKFQNKKYKICKNDERMKMNKRGLNHDTRKVRSQEDYQKVMGVYRNYKTNLAGLVSDEADINKEDGDMRSDAKTGDNEEYNVIMDLKKGYGWRTKYMHNHKKDGDKYKRDFKRNSKGNNFSNKTFKTTQIPFVQKPEIMQNYEIFKNVHLKNDIHHYNNVNNVNKKRKNNKIKRNIISFLNNLRVDHKLDAKKFSNYHGNNGDKPPIYFRSSNQYQRPSNGHTFKYRSFFHSYLTNLNIQNNNNEISFFHQNSSRMGNRKQMSDLFDYNWLPIRPNSYSLNFTKISFKNFIELFSTIISKYLIHFKNLCDKASINRHKTFDAEINLHCNENFHHHHLHHHPHPHHRHHHHLHHHPHPHHHHHRHVHRHHNDVLGLIRKIKKLGRMKKKFLKSINNNAYEEKINKSFNILRNLIKNEIERIISEKIYGRKKCKKIFQKLPNSNLDETYQVVNSKTKTNFPFIINSRLQEATNRTKSKSTNKNKIEKTNFHKVEVIKKLSNKVNRKNRKQSNKILWQTLRNNGKNKSPFSVSISGIENPNNFKTEKLVSKKITTPKISKLEKISNSVGLYKKEKKIATMNNSKYIYNNNENHSLNQKKIFENESSYELEKLVKNKSSLGKNRSKRVIHYPEHLPNYSIIMEENKIRVKENNLASLYCYVSKSARWGSDSFKQNDPSTNPLSALTSTTSRHYYGYRSNGLIEVVWTKSGRSIIANKLNRYFIKNWGVAIGEGLPAGPKVAYGGKESGDCAHSKTCQEGGSVLRIYNLKASDQGEYECQVLSNGLVVQRQSALLDVILTPDGELNVKLCMKRLTMK